MFKFQLRFFRWLVFGVIGLPALWMIGGSLLASHLEKEIERDIAAKLKELEEEYPAQEPNDYALKLRAILSKEFGFGSIQHRVLKFEDYMGYHPDFKQSQESKDEFENIEESLGQYINSQIFKPNDEIEPAPKELQNYLESKADALNKVQNHVLNSELPKSLIGIERKLLGKLIFNDFVIYNSSLYFFFRRHFSYLFSSDLVVYFVQPYSDWRNYQKILALDILEKQRQGQNQEAREMLEVSWRISQDITNNDSYLSIFVQDIMKLYLIGVMRKVNNLPPYWQERLLEHDYHLSIMKAMEEEYLGLFHSIQNYSVEGLPILIDPILIDNALLKPYIRLSAVDYYRTMTQALEGLPTRNVCSPEERATTYLAWGNFFSSVYGDTPSLPWTRRELRAAKYMLELEFTQKILHVKELAKKQGKWPNSIPNLDSKFCPDRQYIYQVSEDGTMTISLEKPPEWLLGKQPKEWPEWAEWAKDRNLSLTYSDRTPPKEKIELNSL